MSKKDFPAKLSPVFLLYFAFFILIMIIFLAAITHLTIKIQEANKGLELEQEILKIKKVETKKLNIPENNITHNTSYTFPINKTLEVTYIKRKRHTCLVSFGGDYVKSNDCYIINN